MNRFIELIREGGASDSRRNMLLVLVAALTNTAVLLMAGGIADQPTRANSMSFAAFVVLALISLVTAHQAARGFIVDIEGGLHRIKLRVTTKIQASELQRFEQLGRADIFDRLSQNLALVSIAGSMTVHALQSLLVGVFALLYVAVLSWTTFVIVTPLLLLGLYAFRERGEQVVDLQRRQFVLRVEYLDRLLDLLHGAKELKLNRARAHAVERQYAQTSTRLGETSAAFNFAWQDTMLFLVGNMYILLALLVFVLPIYVDFELGLVGQLAVVLLFVSSNLQNALFYYALFIDAEQALTRMDELEQAIDGGEEAGVDRFAGPPSWSGPIGAIELEAVEYEYAEGGFRLGPVDLRVEPGELLFIVGGNGAGKSTLLALLTGLYRPSEGGLRFGGVGIHDHNLAAYREQLAVIFTDVHLFARAYGLLDADPNAVRELLASMQIADKTEFAAGRFSNIELSTGQRKRLAMVVALLEDRPIFVLDEWAADQDPEFRRYFYEQLLPSLKARGKTVIAVTHDDRYFHCADRVVALDYGRVRQYIGPPTNSGNP